MLALRHLLSLAILPGTVLILVPRWLLVAYEHSDVPLLLLVSGALVFLIGFALFAWCVSLFVRVGKGTLAPWDPTQHLVAIGPYRYVRNPMIVGVATMLAGEAPFFGSVPIAVWLAIFAAINHAYFILVEERGLARRFGESYDAYKRAVPRWIPRRPRAP
jgi:protein-S-isoprenylcysteine O-methyltransferase Ste14